MAAKDHQLPIDDSVKIPANVTAAADRVAEIHKQVYGDNAAPVAAVEPAKTPEPAPQPAPEPAPQPAPEPAPKEAATGDAEAEHHRYLSMKGRYEQSQLSLGTIQEQLMELGNQNMQLQAQLRRQAQRQPPAPPQAALTDQDVSNYGPELVDFTKRAALDAVRPTLSKLEQENLELKQRLNQQQTVGVYEALEQAVPDWRAINDNPRFKQWCALPDLYSGQVRGQLLNAALRAGHAPRVIAFFKGFQSEEAATGHLPDPQPRPAPQPARQPAIPLASLSTPGREQPSGGGTQATATSANQKPVYTRANIAEFYARRNRGEYVGREDEAAAHERDLFAAQREGRVR
jgi:hypothetical protein